MTVIGTALHGGSGAGRTYYSPWFPRGGDAAVFVAEVIQAGGATATIGIETKNSQSADSAATTLGTPTAVSAVGTTSIPVTGCLELVRFRYVVTPGDSDWIHFRMLNPSWSSN